MLPARGHGVGTTLTTILGTFQGTALAELLGVPTDRGWVNAAAVPCGYPTGRWGLASRRPAHEVVHQDRWGQPPAWTAPRAAVAGGLTGPASSVDDFVAGLPKAELHVHMLGSASVDTVSSWPGATPIAGSPPTVTGWPPSTGSPTSPTSSRSTSR